MFEILAIIALSILAVIMAAVGVGMTNKTGVAKQTQKKSYDERIVDKLNGSSVVGKTVGAAVGIHTFLTKGTGKGLLEDAVNAYKESLTASSNPGDYLLNNVLPSEVKSGIGIVSGIEAAYDVMRQSDYKNIFTGLSGAVGKGREAYDYSLGKYAKRRHDPSHSIEKRDVEDMLNELISSGELPSDTHVNVRIVYGPRDKGDKLKYRGKNEGGNMITIEEHIYNDPLLNKAAQKYALLEEFFHIKSNDEAETKRKVHEHISKNPDKYLDVIFAATKYEQEIESKHKHAS